MNERTEELELVELGEVSEETKGTPLGLDDGGEFPNDKIPV